MHFRKVYWTDWGVVPKIERINFDGNGSSRETLVNKSIWWPTGLAIDHFNNRLYWSDTKLKHFESINLDGTGRKVVKPLSNCKIVYIVYHFLPQVNTFLKLYIHNDTLMKRDLEVLFVKLKKVQIHLYQTRS